MAVGFRNAREATTKAKPFVSQPKRGSMSANYFAACSICPPHFQTSCYCAAFQSRRDGAAQPSRVPAETPFPAAASHNICCDNKSGDRCISAADCQSTRRWSRLPPPSPTVAAVRKVLSICRFAFFFSPDSSELKEPLMICCLEGQTVRSTFSPVFTASCKKKLILASC